LTRDVGSVVTVAVITDPADRYLQDARAVALDDNIPDPVRRRVVPEMCRLSLESRCREKYFARAIRAGTTRVDVEAAWVEARTTRARLALALGEPTPAAMDGWLARGHRKTAVRTCTSALHDGLAGPVMNAIRDVEVLVSDVSAAR
jgi:hypothetical protein